MAKIKYCEHCGAKMQEYRHGLTATQILPLIKLAQAGGVAQIGYEIGLDKSEYGNFAKLQYWGLAEKCDNKERGGKWRVTEVGREFLEGRLAIPHGVTVYRGKVLERHGMLVTIRDLTGGWKYRPQHIADSKPHQESML